MKTTEQIFHKTCGFALIDEHELIMLTKHDIYRAMDAMSKECTKVAYRTKADAMYDVDKWKVKDHVKLHPYFCVNCGKWHLTSKTRNSIENALHNKIKALKVEISKLEANAKLKAENTKLRKENVSLRKEISELVTKLTKNKF
jgi:hypothetical protein